MTQEMKNILTLVVVPLIFGIVIRLLLCKKRKGFIVTIVTGALSVLMFLLALAVYTGGNEYLSLWSLMMLCVFSGSLFTEIAIFITNKISKKVCHKGDFID
jgi:ACR3 family arsenite efflux pump ArsB